MGADELQRAKQPIVEARRKAPENNGFWLGWLARIAAEPAMKAEMLGEPAALDAVSAEQVQAFIRERLVGRAAIEVVARAK
jgi:zinc protease